MMSNDVRPTASIWDYAGHFQQSVILPQLECQRGFVIACSDSQETELTPVIPMNSLVTKFPPNPPSTV